MCKCEERKDRIYDNLLEKGQVGKELREGWEEWFAFDEGRAFESFAKRIHRVVPQNVDDKSTKKEWVRAIAETLLVYLDIGHIEITGSDIYLEGPIYRDKEVSFEHRYTFSEDSELWNEAYIHSEYRTCDLCIERVRSFLEMTERYRKGENIAVNREYQVARDEDKEKKVEVSFLGGNYLRRDVFKDEILEMPLLETATSDTLESFYDSTLTSLMGVLNSEGIKNRRHLFSLLWGLESTKEDKHYANPWAYNIVYEKSSKRGEKGFGYLLTEKQIIHMYHSIRKWSAEEEYPDFWRTYGGLEDEISTEAKLIETAWQMQSFDGFGKKNGEGVGITKATRTSRLPACVDLQKQKIDDVLGSEEENKLRTVEDKFVHSRWITAIPIFSRDVQEHGEDDCEGRKSNFKGMVWLMSDYAIPPFLRLHFLDGVRRDEPRAVNWIERFRDDTKEIKSRIKKKTRRGERAKNAHTRKEARFALEEAKDTAESLPRSFDEKEKLRSAITDAQYCIGSNDSQSTDLQNNLQTTLEAMYTYRDLRLFGKGPVRVSVSESAEELISQYKNRGISEYIFNSAVSLAKNSTKEDVPRYTESGSPPFRFKCLVDAVPSEECISLICIDTAGGLDSEKINMVSKLISSHCDSWERGIYLECDLTRWVTKLRSILSDSESIEIKSTNDSLGWYLILSNEKFDTEAEIENVYTKGHKGLKFNLNINL